MSPAATTGIGRSPGRPVRPSGSEKDGRESYLVFRGLSGAGHDGLRRL